MLETSQRRNDYIGDDSASVFAYNFKIFNKTDLLVIVVDDEGTPEELVVDIDYTVGSVGYDDGSITLLAGPLEQDYKLIILGDKEALQLANIRNRGSFYPNDHENAFDTIVMFIQQIYEILSRVVRLPTWMKSTDFDTTLPTNIADGGEDKFLGVKDDGSGFEIKTGSGSGGGSFPEVSGSAYSLLEGTGVEDPSTQWTDPLVYQGFTERFGEIIDLQGIKPTIDYIMDMGYAPPTVSLSTNPNYATIRERGDLITSTDLTAAIVKTLNDIAEVRFYRGATLLDTQTSGGGIPTGGNSTFTDPTDFSTTTTFSVEVDDVSAESKPSASSSRQFVFVYPYYYGVGAAGLGTGVSGLTKQIITETTNTVRNFTVNGSQKMYFAYPASYGLLTSILDVNSFNTLPDWTLLVANITGLDGNPVSYNIYEFNNFAVAGTFQYTFQQ